MRPIASLFALFCTSLPAEQRVSKVAFTESKSSVRAFTTYGETTLPTVRVQLEILRPDGKTERGNLVVAYDPDSGHYLWHNNIANYSGDNTSLYTAFENGGATVYTAPDALVFFTMPGNLYVQKHEQRADNLDAAERASINDVERRASENTGYGTGATEVPIALAIGREFACGKLGDPDFTGLCRNQDNRIVSIERDAENWRLVVRNRWDQEIILDSKFKLVSTQRLSEPKKE